MLSEPSEQGRGVGVYSQLSPRLLEKGTFLRLQVYKGVGILPDEVKRRVGKSVIQLNIDILKGILFMFSHNTIYY